MHRQTPTIAIRRQSRLSSVRNSPEPHLSKISSALSYGKPLKSSWTTVASWFSNPAERGALASRLLPTPKNRCKNLVLRRFLWSKGKFATEEENSGPVVFEVSEASGIGLDGLDFRIDPFREGVGDVAVEIGQDVG